MTDYQTLVSATTTSYPSAARVSTSTTATDFFVDPISDAVLDAVVVTKAPASDALLTVEDLSGSTVFECSVPAVATKPAPYRLDLSPGVSLGGAFGARISVTGAEVVLLWRAIR